MIVAQLKYNNNCQLSRWEDTLIVVLEKELIKTHQAKLVLNLSLYNIFYFY